MSIIILSCNQWQWTNTALLSLAQTVDVAYETIVFDNGSDSTTRHALRAITGSELAARIGLRTQWSDRNLGVAGGRNAAASHCRGQFLLFLDNDARIVSPTWLKDLRDAMHDCNLGIIGAALFSADAPSVCQFCGGGFDNRGNLVFWTDSERLPLVLGRVVLAPYCLGACQMIRSDIWQILNGFDTAYNPMDYEDIDFCLRARDSGVVTGIAAKVGVLHKGHVTTGVRGFDRLRCYMVNGRRFKRRWAHVFGEVAGNATEGLAT